MMQNNIVLLLSLGTCHEVNRISESACMRINILSSTTVAKNEPICGNQWEFYVAVRYWVIT